MPEANAPAPAAPAVASPGSAPAGTPAPAAPGAPGGVTGGAAAPVTVADRKAKLREAAKTLADSRKAATPDPKAAAAETPTEKAPGAGDGSSPTADAADKPEEAKPEKDLSRLGKALKKLETDQAALETERAAFAAERETTKAAVEAAKYFEPAQKLVGEGKHLEAAKLLFGEKLKDIALAVMSENEADVSETLTRADLDRLLAERLSAREAEREAERVAKEEEKRTETAQRVEKAMTTYLGTCIDTIRTDEKRWPTVARRWQAAEDGKVYLNRAEFERFNRLAVERDPSTGRQSVLAQEEALDRLEKAFREEVLSLPYVGKTPNAEPPSAATRTVTPAWKQGALPPSETAGKSLADRAAERKARLKELAQQG